MKMKSNHNLKDKNKTGNLSLPNHKFKKKAAINNRYQNLQKMPFNPPKPNTNWSNNYLVYESFNKKGYNGFVDPSLSGNNNFLFIKSTGISQNQNSKNMKNSSIKLKRNENSKSQLMKNNHTQIDKIPENKRYLDQNKLFQSETKASLTKKTMPSEEFLKWNNIGFKEIIYKNRFDFPSFDFNNKNHYMLQSYQQLPNRNNEYYRPAAENLGFFNDNNSYNPNYKNYNVNYSLNFYKQKTNQINNSDNMRQNKYSNFTQKSNIKNGNGVNNDLIWSYNRIKYNNHKTPGHLRSIEINNDYQVKPIIKNEFIFKKHKNNNDNISNINNNINNNVFNKINSGDTFIPKDYLSISYNRNFHVNENKNILSNQLDMNKNKNIEKNKTPNNLKKKNISLYQYYKDSAQNPNAINPLGGSYMKNKYKSNDRYKNNEKFIKNICKIQSFWRGGYVRELMSYYWSLSKFKDLLDLILKNHAKRDFFNNFKLLQKENNFTKDNNDIYNNTKYLKSIKEPNGGYNNNDDMNIKNMDKIDIEKLKKDLNKKDEDYDKLLKSYNSIVNKLSELKEKNDENKNINKNKEKIRDEEIQNLFIIDKSNFNIINNNKNLKKFNDIKQEKKEELEFIPTDNNNFNSNNNELLVENFNDNQIKVKLRAKKKEKEKENQKENIIKNNNKELITNNNKIDYNDYLNHFKSNLNIINNEKILYMQSPTIKENDKIKDKPQYSITNFNFSLYSNNNVKKKSTIKQICFNDQISIVNSYSKPQTLLDSDSVLKSNMNDNCEFTTINSGKDIKENKLNCIQENQSDLGTELRETQNTVIRPFKDYIIEEQNNNINIINTKNLKEFDKKLLFVKNDILLDIINQNKSKKENLEQNSNKEKESLDIEKKENYENNNSKLFKDNNNINIYENERFFLINNNKEKAEKTNVNLIIEKNKSISLIEQNKNKNGNNINENLSIFSNNDLIIKGKIKEKCDKNTEITEEINKIEPANHSEIIFQGIEIKKDDINANIININNENDDSVKNEEENKIILRNKKKSELINNKSNISNNKIEINNINDINKNININYNKINEIEKGDGLEINPYEIKRTHNNLDNIFISYENKMQMLNNKNSIYNEKAKINMMKMILPIRINSALKEWIKKNIFKILMYNLKKISFISHLITINNNYMNKNIKKAFGQLKENAKMVKIKNYYLGEFRKTMMKNMLKKYAIYKWNKNLNDLAKLLISNKESIIKNNN